VLTHTLRKGRRPIALRKVLVPALALTLALFGAACSSVGAFVWYQEVPKSDWGSHTGDYVIGVGDTITVRVYDNEPLTTHGKIRSDGRMAFPFAGEVVVAGKHPSDLARELEVRFKEFIVSPRVTVNVDESRPLSIGVVGEVGKPGALALEPNAGLLQALAQAGGMTQYASKSRIFVLRQFPQFRRIRFTYEALIHNDGGAATFPLRNGDVIVVE
jgi:polysaccharide export outer membrane protein